jgi:hypothetical protein
LLKFSRAELQLDLRHYKAFLFLLILKSPPARCAPRGVIWNINKNQKNPDIFETIKDFLKKFFDTYLRFSSEYFRKKNFFFRATSGPGQRFPKDTLIRGKKLKNIYDNFTF